MKLFKYLLLLLSSVIYFGCEQTISLDLPAYQQKLAVECLIDDNPVFAFRISRSTDAFGYQNGVDTFVQITNAIAEFTFEGGTESCTFFELPENPNPFIPTTSNVYGCNFSPQCIGCPVSFRLEHEGQVLTAETFIPAPAIITNVTFEQQVGSFLGYSFDETLARVTVADNPNEENYYKLAWSFSSDGGIPPNSPFEEGRLFFSDEGRQGEAIDLVESIDFFSYDLESIPFNFFVESLSKSAFEYLSTQQAQYDSFEGPFSEPTPILGNINGGLGYFGVQKTSDPFYVELNP